jgi:serine/threonine-protein kinase
VTVLTDILPPRYRGPKRIAHGGMGEIYRATDDVLGRAVAIKLLAERYAADEAIGARFTREALAAARLSGQPNTVMIFDVGEWNDRPFIVMEYLPGGSLADRIAAEGAQPPDRALRWLEQAAGALDAAHRNGIVHRDVKPANLLLDRGAVVHVADFGIASAAGLDSLTATGMVLGTAGYLAPEQAEGLGTTDASDRYALAATAFELLTGERPFRSDSSTAEAAAHIHAPIPSACALRAGLPREVDDVFRRGLAKQPDSRYPTCADLVAHLREALHRSAVPTAAPTMVLPRERKQRPSRLVLGLAALAAAASGIAVAAVLDGGGGGAARTVVERVTAPGTTVQRTVTQATTIQASSPPPAPPPPATPSGHSLNDEAFRKLRQGDYQGAIPLLRQAVAALRSAGPADPYEAYANFNLGFALGQSGRCTEAIPYLATADGLEPHNKEVRRAMKEAAKCAKGGSKE